jgi:glucosamine 6-phosphate synthetase-like amidotransferase/phosphosugar isomerase protein
MKHGPIALIDPDMPVLVIAKKIIGMKRMISQIEQLKRVEAR